MSTLRVVIKWEGGSVLDRGSEAERERHRDLGEALLEKWQADPGITQICYYRVPQTYHCAVYKVRDVTVIDQIDEQLNAARKSGWLVQQHSMEIVLGPDEPWDRGWSS
jgi:hypothetical protein